MVFIGQPKQYVRFSNTTVIRVTGKKGFCFDENGRYETDSDLLCRVLKQHFEAEEFKEEFKEEIKEENHATDDKTAEVKLHKCKHCNYTTANKGELLAHYREHKKEA